MKEIGVGGLICGLNEEENKTLNGTKELG